VYEESQEAYFQDDRPANHYISVYLFYFKADCGDCSAGMEGIACAAEMADLLKLLNAGHEINKGSAMVGLSCLCHYFFAFN
jgi:hypothetical protein